MHNSHQLTQISETRPDLVTSFTSISPSIITHVRPCVRGKFIFVDDEKFFIRGVTYGPFRPDEDGCEYHTLAVVEQDFALMAANGLNTVRTYTVPPRWLLDVALQYGLRVMVGLPWEQHITFLDDRKRAQSIEDRVRDGVRACAGHPAVLCYTIGNEIPAPIVRWYGARRVEQFLHRLYRAAKAEDPEGLVTYVNYPTTEYLQLSFTDFVCFNVYLESEERLEVYLARLQNLAGERPLVMAEIGLDSQRNGEDVQATTLDWQIRTVFAAGCGGAFIFAWTDEWHRGGHDIEDWDFGLTDRNRHPKPALEAVGNAFAEAPFSAGLPWPRVSVIVCSYNGASTIGDCCAGLRQLVYPDFEVIVVDDGSTDETASIARDYEFRVISIPNQGLSNARNTGMEAATGEIIAYIDDDAYPDPDWLTYLAATFLSKPYVGVGGPNITCPDDGPIADCVANAPGNPTHVLLTDQEAEHIPGCNMAFRKEALEAIGGFDPQFRIAGDDVDVCWHLQQQGWKIGFNPAAVVWHHRRNSISAYWKQQVNYGQAEGLLELKWPGKYNAIGHLDWQGKLYRNGLSEALLFQRQRIQHGVWGSGFFQSIYETAPTTMLSILLMPEWYLVIVGLVVLSALGVFWWPLFFALPLLVLAIVPLALQSIMNGAQASFSTEPRSRFERLKMQSLTALLQVTQPLARLAGRLRYGLTPWRRRGMPYYDFPKPRISTIWSETWQDPNNRLENIEETLQTQAVVVKRGGDYDPWDLEIRGGLFGTVRTRMVIEEHGGGKQLIRLRSWPDFSIPGLLVTILFVLLAVTAAINQAWLATGLFGIVAILFALRAFGDCAAATASFLEVLKQPQIGGD